MTGKKRDQALQEQAELLAATIKNVFRERGNIEFSREPVFEKKKIVEFNERMKADGEERFTASSFVSYINYYRDVKGMKRKNTLGAVVIYVEQEYADFLLQKLKYSPSKKDKDKDYDAIDEKVEGGVGAICNVIAGAYKSTLVSGGYKDLEMSHFTTYRNKAFYGVDFCYEEFDAYEIHFYIDNKKRLVVTLTMGAIPKAQ